MKFKSYTIEDFANASLEELKAEKERRNKYIIQTPNIKARIDDLNLDFVIRTANQLREAFQLTDFDHYIKDKENKHFRKIYDDFKKSISEAREYKCLFCGSENKIDFHKYEVVYQCFNCDTIIILCSDLEKFDAVDKIKQKLDNWPVN